MHAASEIWLLGGMEEIFKASKLLYCGEVLRVLFHFHDREQMGLKDSIIKTTEPEMKELQDCHKINAAVFQDSRPARCVIGTTQ